MNIRMFQKWQLLGIFFNGEKWWKKSSHFQLFEIFEQGSKFFGYPVFEAMASLPRSMASSLVALPRSCHDLGKDAMAMQDCAKANHD